MFRSENNKPPLTGFGLPSPAAYELGSLESRAAARALLDAKLNVDQRKRFRLVVERIGGQGNLEMSTCTCSLFPDGTVSEFVEFHGSDPTEVEREQLEKLIRKIPIDGRKHRFAEAVVQLTTLFQNALGRGARKGVSPHAPQCRLSGYEKHKILERVRGK